MVAPVGFFNFQGLLHAQERTGNKTLMERGKNKKSIIGAL